MNLGPSLEMLKLAFGGNPLPVIRKLELARGHSMRKDSQFWLGTLYAALELKAVAGQVNVMAHAAGILAALPHILEPSESVESLSLGAGNTGKGFDVTTDRRVAEFKFIQWRGGPEAIRQNQVFKDFLKLLWDDSGRRQQLFLTGTDEALRFLRGRRSLSSILSRNVKLRDEFQQRYGDSYRVVGEFYRSFQHQVEIIDLNQVLGLDQNRIPADTEALDEL